MTILNILNELAATSSTLEKTAILKREKDNALLKLVFQTAYNPMINFGIKKIPEYTDKFHNMPLVLGIKQLDELVLRNKTGNAAIEYLTSILSSLSVDDAVVLERIISRDLRCGASDSLASRVWPGFIPSFDVMLSHKDISGIKFPAYAQNKNDGARAHIYFDGKHAKALSRSGKEFQLLGVLDNDIKYILEAGEVLDGELICVRNGKVLERKEGNGILNKCSKGTISKEEAELIRFVSWDIPDFSSTIPYKNRIELLTHSYEEALCFAGFTGKISVLPTIIVNNEDEAQAFFEARLAEGEEGAMIKNIMAVWQPKRTKDLGKMKAEEVADLKVVAWYPGRPGTKYENAIGGLVCQTSDGLLEVNVGGGLSDEDRLKNPAEYLDKIVEVMYNQKIKSKDSRKAWSLFLPRLLSVRFDKIVANSLGELK